MKTQFWPEAIVLTAATLMCAATVHAESVRRAIDESHGNSYVEAGFYAAARATVCGMGGGADSYCNSVPAHDERVAEVVAYGRGTVELFGLSKYASVTARGRDVDGIKSTYAKIYAIGQTLHEEERDAIYITRILAFQKSKSVGVGGLTVTVRGTATFIAGIALNGDMNAERLLVTGEPFADAVVSASASIGVACANAKIKGSIMAAHVGLPTTLELTFGDDIDYRLDVDLDYRLMDGDIKVKLNYCLGDASKTLVSYNGWRGRRDVYATHGTF